MKYYCSITELEYDGEYAPCAECRNLPEKAYCNNALQTIPEPETVAAWEKRKGKKYPDTAPVYARGYYDDGKHWHLLEHLYDHNWMPGPVVATEAGPPPENWHPLDCGKCSKAAEERVCTFCDKE